MAKKTEPGNIEALKTEALKTVHLPDPLLTYKRFFRGREAEYSYRDFLDSITVTNPEIAIVPENEINDN